MAERLVEIIHLCHDGYSSNDHEYIGRRKAELIVAIKRKFEGNAECFHRHDRDGAHGGANGQIYKGVLFAVFGSHPVNHDDGKHDDCKTIRYKPWTLSAAVSRLREAALTWPKGMIENLTDIFYLFVWRRVKHNDHRAQEADCTAQLSERTKLFFQKVGTKHRTTSTQRYN